MDFPITQDCVLGYSQPSLRDSREVFYGILSRALIQAASAVPISYAYK
jgi:hypothetical protein